MTCFVSWSFSVEYFTSVLQDILLVPSLEEHEADFLQSGVVIQFLTTINAPCKIYLDSYFGFYINIYINDLVQVPNRATVLQFPSRHC